MRSLSNKIGYFILPLIFLPVIAYSSLALAQNCECNFLRDKYKQQVSKIEAELADFNDVVKEKLKKFEKDRKITNSGWDIEEGFRRLDYLGQLIKECEEYHNPNSSP